MHVVDPGKRKFIELGDMVEAMIVDTEPHPSILLQTSTMGLAHGLLDGWSTSWSSMSFTVWSTSLRRANNILLIG